MLREKSGKGEACVVRGVGAGKHTVARMRPPEDFTIRVAEFPCGCRYGKEFSECAWDLSFHDHCGTHDGLPNVTRGTVRYY